MTINDINDLKRSWFRGAALRPNAGTELTVQQKSPCGQVMAHMGFCERQVAWRHLCQVLLFVSDFIVCPQSSRQSS